MNMTNMNVTNVNVTNFRRPGFEWLLLCVLVIILEACPPEMFAAVDRPQDAAGNTGGIHEPARAIPPGSQATDATASAAAAKADELVPPEVKKLREMLREGPEPFSLQEAQEFLRQVVPVVEKVTRRTFARPLTLRLAGRREVAESLFHDIVPQFRQLLPQADENQLIEAARREAGSMVPLLLGKYGFTDKVLYLLPRNFPPLLKIVGVDPRETSGVALLLMAHEVAHAMQDQELKLNDRLAAIKDQEESLAFGATIEGHAMWVMETVGRELKMTESVIAASRLFAGGAITFDDPLLQLMNTVLASRYESTYLGGKRFIEHHLARLGPEKIWTVLANPPKNTAMILNPSSYSPDAPVKADFSSVFAGMAEDLGKPGSQVQNVEVGHMTLRSVYAPMDPKKREDLLAGLTHVQAFVVVATDTGDMGNVSLLILKDPQKAPTFVTYLEEMAGQNQEKLKGSSLVRIVDAKTDDFDFPGTSVARRMKIILATSENKRMKQAVYRIAKGNVLLEIIDGNVGIAEEKITRLSRVIFERVEKLLGKAPAKEN